jgi:hypothetical protein
MLNKEFVPYEESLELKELGFNEPCIATIDQTEYLHIKGTKNQPRGSMIYDTIPAPLYQQAFRWFREKQEIEGFVHKSIEGNYYFVIKRTGNNENNMYEFTKTAPKIFDTYEEAELACLKKLIKTVKDGN